ncbi:glypican-6 [Bactrocera tryoni]|uniref:glypican-6 n=1 Tax=Bactrocera tryoni TaxID=59916 RepID=UPI001A98BA97|nr:glypican-6 [Bactrocera tryoni]XP_039964864.1 glypican-6 [Bactrocera tryoni]
MQRLSRTSSATATLGSRSKTMISKGSQRAVSAVAKRRLPAASKKYLNLNFCTFTLLSYLILLFFCARVHAQGFMNHTHTLSDMEEIPHISAVATELASSSVIDQFMPNCTKVAPVFKARGIDQAELPLKPNNEMGLRYCETPSVGTCCTFNMETRLALQSRMQLEKQSKEQITKLSNALAAKAQKYNSIFRKLLGESKEEFHKMFTRTYGVIYQQNSYVFSDLFNELENYYTRGRVDLLEVMDKFFNTLYQKMFQVLNGQTFEEKFLKCVSEHMKELKPFGDVPDKLAVQIKRSFVATRTYWQALHTAAEVSKKMMNVRLNADCTAALTKMQHCGACKGYAEKPCTNYCVNVIKGCLHFVHEFDTEWENFAVAMDKVAERLLGSFNIVMVVEPINIKISEAIMNFQESSQSITSRVFEGCGRPSIGRTRRAVNPKFSQPVAIQQPQAQSSSIILTSSDSKVIRKRATLDVPTEQIESDILDIDADVDDAIVLRERRAAEPITDEQSADGDKTNDDAGVGGGAASNGGGRSGGRDKPQRRKNQQNRKNDDDNGRDPNLDKLVREIRQRVKESKKFWSNLPHQICSNDEISTSSDVDGMCWNGHTIDRYMHPVTSEQSRNPEFPGNPATTSQTSQVATQLFYLKNVINHLRNAYNGQDVDWSDQEDALYGSGAGSGAGSDDEDDDEGSGLSGGPFTPPHMKPTDRPGSMPANNIDDEDEEDVEERRITDSSHTTRPKYPGSVGAGVETAAGGDTNSIDEDEDADDDNDLNEEKSGSGSAGAKTAPKMTLRRALLLYLLPLYMAWFGGVVADML